MHALGVSLPRGMAILEVAVGLQEDKLFRVNHTDPWVRNDPFRTSRTLAFQTTRSSGTAIHGPAADDLAAREGALPPPRITGSSSCSGNRAVYPGLGLAYSGSR